MFVYLLFQENLQVTEGRVKMSREKILSVQTAVRGFHFYKSIWAPKESDILSCEHEENNPYDLFAIKTCQENGTIVGHLPIEISRISKFLLDRGARIQAKLRETHYRRSPLVQGGLEIPCTLVIRMPGTIKSTELLKKYLELFEERYEEPQEIVILGTFHVSLPKQLDTTTTTLTNRSSATARKPGPSKTSATIVAKNKSKDIRAMFKKIARKNAEQEPEAENDNVQCSFD